MKRRTRSSIKTKSAPAKVKSGARAKKGTASVIRLKARRTVLIKPKLSKRKSKASKVQLLRAHSKSVPYPEIDKKGNSNSSNAAAAIPRPSIVRIMGRGQFRINAKILKRLDQVDASIVELVSKEKSDDVEFRKRLCELAEIVLKGGTPLPATEIIKSDVILPSPELSIDEAKKLFASDGVIPAF